MARTEVARKGKKISYKEVAGTINAAVFNDGPPPDKFFLIREGDLRAIEGPNGVFFIEQNPRRSNRGGRVIQFAEAARRGHHVLWCFKRKPGGGSDYAKINGKTVGIIDGLWVADMNAALTKLLS